MILFGEKNKFISIFMIEKFKKWKKIILIKLYLLN